MKPARTNARNHCRTVRRKESIVGVDWITIAFAWISRMHIIMPFAYTRTQQTELIYSRIPQLHWENNFSFLCLCAYSTSADGHWLNKRQTAFQRCANRAVISSIMLCVALIRTPRCPRAHTHIRLRDRRWGKQDGIEPYPHTHTHKHTSAHRGWRTFRSEWCDDSIPLLLLIRSRCLLVAHFIIYHEHIYIGIS